MTGDDERPLRAVAVIPARLGSTRLPAKALLAETGSPLIVHTLVQAQRARSLAAVVVATDDERIAAAVRAAGGDARMTRANHLTGSDRIGELLPGIDADIIVNVQGDEPEIDPALIDELVAALRSDADADVATAASPVTDAGRFADLNTVKVVVDARGHALYFSRAPIPGARAADAPATTRAGGALAHIGVYAYRRAALARFLQLPPSALEIQESLEQLRLLENGYRYRIIVTAAAHRGIDTPDDYAAFVRRHRERTSDLGTI